MKSIKINYYNNRYKIFIFNKKANKKQYYLKNKILSKYLFYLFI